MDLHITSMHALAFHRELVASRRLAKREGITVAAALEQVLCASAGEQGLNHLLEMRRQQFNLQKEMQQRKRQSAQQKHAEKQARKATPTLRWCGWFDGSARPNPGACAIGLVLRAPDGREWQRSNCIGDGNSSEAEYQALIALLNLAIAEDARDLVIFGDSRVVIDDLDEANRKPAQDLTDLRLQTKELLRQLSGACLQWIPRARNQQADHLAQRAFEKNIYLAGHMAGAERS